MASTEAIKRLETRADAAEKLIEFLKEQIAEIKAAAKGHSSSQRYAGSQEMSDVEALKAENEQLKLQVEEWKQRLVAAEKAKGIVQVQAPSSVGHILPSKNGAAVGEFGDSVEKKLEVKKKEKTEKKPQQSRVEEVQVVDVGRLDLRVGLIRSAKKHPDADSLYVEEVDVGEEKPRTVISGLVKFIPEDQMQNRLAILLCNLKPSKMRGIVSEAMVMCGSTPEKVEILSPPDESKPGDPIHVEGYERNPDTQLNPKKKVFESCAPDLKLNENGVATYKGVPWTVNGKFCKSQTLVNVNIR